MDDPELESDEAADEEVKKKRMQSWRMQVEKEGCDKSSNPVDG